jgi:hypothetical protein
MVYFIRNQPSFVLDSEEYCAKDKKEYLIALFFSESNLPNKSSVNGDNPKLVMSSIAKMIR